MKKEESRKWVVTEFWVKKKQREEIKIKESQLWNYKDKRNEMTINLVGNKKNEVSFWISILVSFV